MVHKYHNFSCRGLQFLLYMYNFWEDASNCLPLVFKCFNCIIKV